MNGKKLIKVSARIIIEKKIFRKIKSFEKAKNLFLTLI